MQLRKLTTLDNGIVIFHARVAPSPSGMISCGPSVVAPYGSLHSIIVFI